LTERKVKLRIGHNVQFMNDTGHTPSDLKGHRPKNVETRLIDIWKLLDKKYTSIIHSKIMIIDK
jgi:hypothetical protein